MQIGQMCIRDRPLPIELAFLIVSYVILGGDVVWQAVRNISKGRVFDEMCIRDRWNYEQINSVAYRSNIVCAKPYFAFV